MSLSRNAAYNLLGAALPLVLTLLTVPLYLELVGIERYGALTLCWVVLGYFGFLDLGLGPAVSQRIAASRGDSEAAEAVFSTALVISLVMGLLGAALFWAGAAAYLHLESPASPLWAEFEAAIPILAAMLPVAMMSSVTGGTLQGRERFLTLNLIVACSSTLMSVLPLAAAYLWEPTLGSLAFGAVAARAVGIGLAYGASRRALGASGFKGIRRELVLPLLRFGGWVTVATAAAPLLLTVDRLAIGAMLGAAAVAAYSIPFSLVARLNLVPSSLASALFPRFAAADDSERLRLIAESFPAMAVVMTPVVGVVMLVAEPFFSVWIGEELAATSAPVAYILLLGIWINSFAQAPYSLLQGSGRPEVVSKLLLAEIVPYWLVLLAGLWSFGLLGAAAAWSLRVAVDAMLLSWRAGVGLGSLKRLAVPLALTLCAFGAANLLQGMTRHATLAAFLGAMLVWAWLTMPDTIRLRLRWAFGELKLRRLGLGIGPE